MEPDTDATVTESLAVIAAELNRQNELLEEQNERLREVADGIEDRVIQTALVESLDLGTDDETRRRRQL